MAQNAARLQSLVNYKAKELDSEVRIPPNITPIAPPAAAVAQAAVVKTPRKRRVLEEGMEKGRPGRKSLDELQV